VLLASSLVVVVALAVGVLGFTLALGRILTNSAAEAAKAQANQIASVVTAGEYTATAAVHDLPTQGSLIQIIDAAGVVIAASDSSAAAPRRGPRKGNPSRRIPDGTTSISRSQPSPRSFEAMKLEVARMQAAFWKRSS